ncbi:uncharacterized protein LOC116180546 isoform X4 [Photinus pyralis]|nr:uncharacterized protein LOC116180546 isoform X4 [Photinus pyralis]
MDPPPHKRPRMGLLPQTQPQLGLNNLEDWSPFPNANYPTVSQRSAHLGPPTPASWLPPSFAQRGEGALKDEGLTIYLSKEFFRCLLNKEGATFRTILAEDLGVSIGFVNPDAELVTCKLEGCAINLEKAETAVLTFCEKKKLKRKDVVPFFNTDFGDRSLAKNLLLLHSPKACWFDRASELQTRIFELDEAACGSDNNKREKELSNVYRQLNAIIICKLRNGDGQRHMDILEEGANHHRDVVRRSFDYVFNNDRPMFPDYDALLAQLSNSVSDAETEDFKRWELEKLRRRAALICSRNGWGTEINKISAQYARIIVNGYDDFHIGIFRSEYEKLETRHSARTEAQKMKRIHNKKRRT